VIPSFSQVPGKPSQRFGAKWRRHRAAGLPKTRLHGRKGTTLPSFSPDPRWIGVHVAVAKGGDRRAVILSTIAANSLRGIATSAI